MIKIKIGKHSYLNNLGSTLLNDINTESKNMYACHPINWKKTHKIVSAH